MPVKKRYINKLGCELEKAWIVDIDTACPWLSIFSHKFKY